MAENKYNLVELNDRLIKLLKLDTNAVAIKYITEESQLENIPNKEYAKEGFACMSIGFSAYFPKTVVLRGEDFLMHYCAACNGCQKQDEEWYSGEALANPPLKWFSNPEASKQHILMMKEGVPDDNIIAFVTSPLWKMDITDPDVISIQCPPGAAFHFFAGLIETSYRKLEFPFIGESSCADTWGWTYKTGKPGLSLGCRGDRGNGDLAPGEVRITVTLEDLETAIKGMERLKADDVLYPYYPRTTMIQDYFPDKE
ncbi:MAG: DUF169 domain-containing protein [Ruminococcus sp.]|nr:DUF169 domain-containing protein [Ruminococcus sp.]